MKHKLLKLNAVLLLGLGVTPLQSQTTINVKATDGTQIAYNLSSIRKLTFPITGNMEVSKTTGSTDTYSLTAIRYLNFSYTANSIKSTSADIKSKLRLYPNPVVDVLNIQLSISGNQPTTVELLSIEGKLLYKVELTDTTDLLNVNISHLQQGIYLCRVNNGINIETTKFIKL